MMSDMDARKAVTMVIEKLTTHDGYYVWTALGDPAVWLLRVPKENKNEEWEKQEVSDMIHLCRPIKFVEAMSRNDRKDLSVFAGYIIDSKCVRCKQDIPEDVEKRLAVQIKLSKLRKKAV
jgi:hypothetical protein